MYIIYIIIYYLTPKIYIYTCTVKYFISYVFVLYKQICGNLLTLTFFIVIIGTTAFKLIINIFT